MSGDFWVGDWCVQPAANRLRRGGDTVRLEPKVMQVLVCLAEQAGEVVTRDALVARVWPDVFVTDDGLHRAIRELRRVFGDSSTAPRYIETIRKRGYRLMVTTADVGPAPPAIAAPQGQSVAGGVAPAHAVLSPLPARTLWSRPLAAAAILAAASIAAIVGLLPRENAVTEAHARFAALVSGPANESDPAIAADGQRLAFVQRDSATDQADIYVQPRPGAAAERLTTDPADDRLPRWSPDGRRLAFVRLSPGRCDIVVRSVDAAGESRIGACLNPDEPRLAWTGDGQSLIVSEAIGGRLEGWRLSRLPLAGGAAVPLTSPPAGATGDHSPAVSPDGRSIAFIRQSTGGIADVFVVPIGGGAARRVTGDESDLTGVDWTARGRGLVFSSDRAGGYSLWRVGVEGGEPQLVAGGAARLKHPASARDVERVAYESWSYEINIGQVTIGNLPEGMRTIVDTSDLWNLYPALSPDGRQLAYVSTQSGSHELWLASHDGSARRQLTAFGGESRALARGTAVRAPRWSPDNRHLVFAAQRGGRVDIYVIDTATGALTAVTDDDAIETAPSFAADGARVFYSRRDGGRSAIWAREVSGGAPPTLVVADAVAAQAGAAAELFFTRADSPGVWRLASGAGAPVLVTPRIAAGDALNWVATARGLYFAASHGREIGLFHVAHAGDPPALVTTLPRYSWPGVSMSADGARVLYARWDRRESNIMAAEMTSR